MRLQHGDVDTALVYGFGKSSLGDLHEIMTLQLDPYYLAPLWPDMVSLAALQARAYLEASGKTRARPGRGRGAQPGGARARTRTRSSPATRRSTRSSPRPRRSVAAARRPTARRSPTAPPRSCSPPATGPDGHQRPAGLDPGDRPPHRGALARRARPRDVACRPSRPRPVPAPPTTGSTSPSCTRSSRHEELILRDALGLADDVVVNPSGGPLAANPVMATGLIRIGEAAHRVLDGDAGRARRARELGPVPATQPGRGHGGGLTMEPTARHRRRADQAQGRSARTSRSPGLVREAARAALDDAELDWADIDAVVHRQGARHVRGRRDARAVPRRRARRGRQADDARAHGRQRRRLDRARRRRPGAGRDPRAGAHGRVREAVGERRDVGAHREPAVLGAAGRRRRRLLRAAHPRLHARARARPTTSACSSR